MSLNPAWSQNPFRNCQTSCPRTRANPSWRVPNLHASLDGIVTWKTHETAEDPHQHSQAPRQQKRIRPAFRTLWWPRTCNLRAAARRWVLSGPHQAFENCWMHAWRDKITWHNERSPILLKTSWLRHEPCNPEHAARQKMNAPASRNGLRVPARCYGHGDVLHEMGCEVWLCSFESDAATTLSGVWQSKGSPGAPGPCANHGGWNPLCSRPCQEARLCNTNMTCIETSVQLRSCSRRTSSGLLHWDAWFQEQRKQNESTKSALPPLANRRTRLQGTCAEALSQLLAAGFCLLLCGPRKCRWSHPVHEVLVFDVLRLGSRSLWL